MQSNDLQNGATTGQTKTLEYRLIESFYKNRCAERSGVPLMNHIDEGLKIMDSYNASEKSKRAFCLHPLFQNDKELVEEGLDILRHGIDLDPEVILLVMEYRNKANAWLSDKVKKNKWYYVDTKQLSRFILEKSPDPGPLEEVRHMLIADKLQNYKDFCKYHMATHERSEELVVYFQAWFAVLNVQGYNV